MTLLMGRHCALVDGKTVEMDVTKKDVEVMMMQLLM